MKIAGIDLINVGRKPEHNKVESVSPSKEEPQILYPTIRCDSSSEGWNLPINLEPFKAGERAILVALVNVKEKIRRESDSETDKESNVTGELEFLKVGIEKSDMGEGEHISNAKEKLESLLSSLKDE